MIHRYVVVRPGLAEAEVLGGGPHRVLPLDPGPVDGGQQHVDQVVAGVAGRTADGQGQDVALVRDDAPADGGTEVAVHRLADAGADPLVAEGLGHVADCLLAVAGAALHEHVADDGHRFVV